MKRPWAEIPRTPPDKRAPEERVCDFREIYALYDEAAVREQASRCLQCPTPQCRTGCPLANRIPEWLALAAEGQFLEAAAISQSTSNMPELCSRVCPQERLCEGACVLNARWEPVCIGAIERYINEYAFVHGGVPATRAPWNGFRVCVVGAGPAGMACADELAKLGYAVTVFEALQLPGGLLVNGIPAFKLEKHLVARRIDVLKERGVEFRLGVTLGRDLALQELRETFDSIFISIGAQQPKPLDVPGGALLGVFDALPFLIEKNTGPIPRVPPIGVEGKNVVVLGGGDTAMDCLRTALRCHASKATCVYRRNLENMPGSRKEYANAVEEGAIFQFLTTPVAVEGDSSGRVSQVRCVRMELGDPDANGRRKPFAVPGSEFAIPAEVVLIAYGFDPVPFAETSLGRVMANDWGCVKTDSTQMTNLAGVFAGGDIVRGPSLVVNAVRDGRRAAAGIHDYLSNQQARSKQTNGQNTYTGAGQLHPRALETCAGKTPGSCEVQKTPDVFRTRA